jgi:hypothetical protein
MHVCYSKIIVTDGNKKKKSSDIDNSDSERECSKTRGQSSSPEDDSRTPNRRSGPGSLKKKGVQLATSMLQVHLCCMHAYSIDNSKTL